MKIKMTFTFDIQQKKFLDKKTKRDRKKVTFI